MTKQDEINFNESIHCHICGKELKPEGKWVKN